MGRMKRGAVPLLLAVLLGVTLGWPGAAGARSGTEVELLSGLGYTSTAAGPSVLLGAELSAYSRQGSFFTGLQESRVGLHLSDVLSEVFSPEAGEHTFTIGVDASWTRTQGPFSFTLGGQAFYRQRGEELARSAGLSGTGVTGRIVARFRADYVESSLGSFPWFQRDLEGMSQAAGDGPFYRAQAGVSASIIPALRLNWSQEVRWRRPVAAPDGVFSVTTGPQFDVGSGTIGAQGGLLFDAEGIEPIWQIRYELRPFESNVDFQLTAATRSLDGDGPVIYGWLGIDGERMGFGGAVRLERTETGEFVPAIYISLHPKF